MISKKMTNFSSCLVLLLLLKTCMTIILRLQCGIFADFSIILNGMADPQSPLKSFIGKTKRECALECSSEQNCKSVNYKQIGGNCELIGRNLSVAVNHLISRTGWVYMTTDEEGIDVGTNCTKLSPCQNGGKCMDTCTAPGFQCTCTKEFTGTHCENEKEYASCKAVYDAGHRVDGIFKLTNMGHHFCKLTTLSGCRSGGWTLIMKTDGNTNLFGFNANYWSTSNVWNAVYGLKDGEAKFDAYNKLAFTQVCIGMEQGGTTRYLEITYSSTSMLDLLKDGSFKSVSIPTSSWLALISGSGIQMGCHRRGFNVNPSRGGGSDVSARIGINGNEAAAGCDHGPDSVLGIGIKGSFCENPALITTGNQATCMDGGQSAKHIKTKGLIYIQ